MSRIGATKAAVVAVSLAGGCASAPASSSAAIFAAPPRSAADLLPGPQLRGLAFDTRGAEFAAWVEEFERRVHHNWVVPKYFGYGGDVEFSLVVERNGTLTGIEVLESTASAPLKRAAHDAFAMSRLPPLPKGFDRLRVRLRVTCIYGPPPGE
jgi:hypothetical protein